MSFNGSGTYTLPGAPLVSGEIVSSTENNQFRNDVAGAFNKTMCRDGQSTATANLPMGNHKLTGLAAGSANGESVRYEQVTSDVDITGGTISGVTLIDPEFTGTLSGDAISITGGSFSDELTGPKYIVSDYIQFGDGSFQTTALYAPKFWAAYTATDTFEVPLGVGSVRLYAFGAGGDGSTGGAGGGGGGCAFGDFSVNSGDVLNIAISSGISTVSFNGTTLLTANPGNNASSGTGGSGGSASKHVSITNGGSYSGGAGGNFSSPNCGGGGASGSPLGIGGAGGTGGGGGGAGGSGGTGGGGAGGNGSGGGAGSGGNGYESAGGIGRLSYAEFSDPLLVICNGTGGAKGIDSAGGSGGPGGGGGYAVSGAGGYTVQGGTGGVFGGGGFASSSLGATGGAGGFGGGGGGAKSSSTARGGDGGFGAGGGGASGSPAYEGLGGEAIVLVYY